MTQEETEYMKRPIPDKEMESVHLKLPLKKSPGPDHYTSKLYQTHKRKIYLIL